MAEKLGFKCHETDVGFKNISAKMRETDALIGGESSGGLTCRGYLFGKDSAFSVSLFMEMQIVMDKPVSEIVREAREFAGYAGAVVEKAVPLADGGATNAYLLAKSPISAENSSISGTSGAISNTISKAAHGRSIAFRAPNPCSGCSSRRKAPRRRNGSRKS